MRRLVASCVCVLAAACGQDPPSPAWRRVELFGEARARAAEPEATPVTNARLLAADEHASWKIESRRRTEVAPSPLCPDGPDALNFRGAEAKEIRVPGSFDPTRFDRVALTVLSRGHTRVIVSFGRGGERVGADVVAFVEKSSEPRLVTVPFHQNQLHQEPFDELRLRFAGEGGALAVYAVELQEVEGFPELPAPGAEPPLTFLGDDGRRAVRLTAARPLKARLAIGRSSELSLVHGIPPELFFARAAPAVRVELTHEDGSRLEESFALQPNRWIEERIDLSAWPAGEVEATFQLEAGGLETACLIGEVGVAEPTGAPPTVLVITSDTHRADHLGAARSGSGVATPTLDALAARGVLFEDAWSQTNVTIPSHAALLTGMHPRDLRVIDNKTRLADSAPTLTEHFRDAGYATWSLLGTRHLGDRYSGLGQGFDRMSTTPSGRRPAAQTIDQLEAWLETSERKPLFVWLHLFDAHAPYRPPEPFAGRYTDALPRSPAGTFKDPEAAQRGFYKGEVSYLDRELARVLDHPRFRDATIAFTADHGESLGAHDILFQHVELYPDTVRVPLVLAWPGAPAGTRVPGRARQMDVGRTLLDLAGLGAVEFPGRSLIEEHAGEPLFALASEATSASVLHEGWLLVLHLAAHQVPGNRGPSYAHHQVELFHLAEDPDCLVERSVAEPGRARRLRELLIAWLGAGHERGFAEAAVLDAQSLDNLEALGYAGGTATSGDEAWFTPDGCENCAPFRD